MDERHRNAGRFVGIVGPLVAVMFGIVGSGSAGASSITIVRPTHEVSGAHESHQLQVLETYLDGGPRHWARTKPPKVLGGIKIETSSGAFKDSALTEFLAWEQARNPTVFDARHPRIASLVTEARELNVFGLYPPLKSRRSEPPPLVQVGASSSGALAEAQVLVAPSPVPEPASWMLGVLLCGALAWWRRCQTLPASPRG